MCIEYSKRKILQQIYTPKWKFRIQCTGFIFLQKRFGRKVCGTKLGLDLVYILQLRKYQSICNINALSMHMHDYDDLQLQAQIGCESAIRMIPMNVNMKCVPAKTQLFSCALIDDL